MNQLAVKRTVDMQIIGDWVEPGTRVLDDKWTAVTADGSYSAHFEHCVAVTKDGPVILTQ